MKHFLLKFNVGVETGAYLAYLGHFNRTGEPGIHRIMREEQQHKNTLLDFLEELGEEPSLPIVFFFLAVGSVIKFMCSFMPLWSLNFVARTMELFAVFSYKKIADLYPSYSRYFMEMAETEQRHEEYFRLGPDKYAELQTLRRSIKGGVYGRTV